MLQYSKDEACQIVKPSGDFKVYLLKAQKLRWKIRMMSFQYLLRSIYRNVAILQR